VRLSKASLDLCTVMIFWANQGERDCETVVYPHVNEDWAVHFNADAAEKVHGAEVYIITHCKKG